jgi:hypothetical protein
MILTDFELGIDVSRYQNEPILDKNEKIVDYKPLDYQKAKDKGVKFAIVRSTVGDYYIDPTFVMNFKGFEAVGIETSTFFVTAPRDSGLVRKITAERHVQKLFEAFALLGKTPTTPITMDNELVRGASSWEITALYEKLFSMLPSTTINYTRANWWNTNVRRSDNWKSRRLHVAHYMDDIYNFDPDLPLDWPFYYIHQFSADKNGQGKKYGAASSDIDLNRRIIGEELPPSLPSSEEFAEWVKKNVKVTIDGRIYRIEEEI